MGILPKFQVIVRENNFYFNFNISLCNKKKIIKLHIYIVQSYRKTERQIEQSANNLEVNTKQRKFKENPLALSSQVFVVKAKLKL